MPKAIASLSLDLDNEWAYLKTHGDPVWESLPSYLDTVVPRALEFLKQRGLRITFFVVGQDAVVEGNRGALRSIADAGHEIGSHSFAHEPWMNLYSAEQVERDISLAEESIARVMGTTPRGFRGPGFSFSPQILEVLQRRGYAYDASTFPTFIGPLARLYYFAKSSLSRTERLQRHALFGNPGDGFRPNRPYVWGLSRGELLEIPVTTMPGLRIPIHASYVIYLACFSPALARAYFAFALWLCRLTRTQPSLLLHSLDFLGKEDNQRLGFFPGMQLARQHKLDMLSRIVEAFATQYEVLPLGEYAKRINERTTFRVHSLSTVYDASS